MTGRSLHPELTPARRRALFRRGLELFDAGRYFECHEAFEEIWRSTTPEPRDLFQGLIQVAVGLHHWHARRRPDVARRVLAKGRRRLAPLAPACRGLDLHDLLAAVAAWESWLAHPSGQPPPAPRIAVVDPPSLR
ncbi:MAG: DUF309 domain-containing protein [Acidobacteria bacterium]|nr:MAG: DUF309 domain-containing protein [Acidobacteriota bacterium]